MINPPLQIFVEGAGTSDQKIEFRRSFSKFMQSAGVSLPVKLIPCGSRKCAFDDFSIAVQNGESAILLVDSEDPVLWIDQKPISPWKHVRDRKGDSWKKPDNASDALLHFMAPVMEAWFIADAESPGNYYSGKYNGDYFNAKKIANVVDVELLSKRDIEHYLATATSKNQVKRQYHKGRHFFEILANINPRIVAAKSYHSTPTLLSGSKTILAGLHRI